MLKRILLLILANAAALYFTVEFMAGDFLITGGLKGYLIAAITFGVLNSLLKPLLKIISLPFVLLTAGLFILVINTFLIWFAEYALGILDFENVAIIIDGGIGTYLTVAIIISIANFVIQWLVRK